MQMETSSDQGEVTEESFNSSLQHLKDLQREYEMQEKYAEAERIENQIQKLKEKKRKKDIMKLKNRQRSERHSIDSIYKSESKNFNNRWENVLNSNLERFKDQEDELSKKHKKMYEEEKETLEKNAPCFFKPSAQLLNIIKCKEKAVTSKKYREAQKLANEIESALEIEKKMYIENRQAKIDKQLSIFQKKLDKELEVLRLKQEAELREINKQRCYERENMERKVENICRELENAQNIQINIAKGLHTTNAGRQSPHRSGSSFRSDHSTPSKFLVHKKSMSKAS